MLHSTIVCISSKSIWYTILEDFVSLLPSALSSLGTQGCIAQLNPSNKQSFFRWCWNTWNIPQSEGRAGGRTARKGRWESGGWSLCGNCESGRGTLAQAVRRRPAIRAQGYVLVGLVPAHTHAHTCTSLQHSHQSLLPLQLGRAPLHQVSKANVALQRPGL